MSSRTSSRISSARSTPRAARLPWRDRAGRFSPLKGVTFLAVLAPGVWIALAWAMGWYAPKPVTEAIHQNGLWAVRLILASLAVTPLRRIGNWPKLILIRRMLGVAAFVYVAIHFALYCLDQGFDLGRVASEIALRIYLTIGFVALLGLAVLAATSTDAMIRRLGRRWQTLHRAIYVITPLALIHFYLQSKIDVTEAVFMTGLFGLAFAYRLMHRLAIPLRAAPLAGAALLTGALTALVETAWYAATTGAPWQFILAANLDVETAIRPAWWVMTVGFGIALIAAVRLPQGGNPGRAARFTIRAEEGAASS
ncbi:sulfite oxidase heme-binding subunit YedZ [Chelatococcus asaccharovorans]|uniref:Protein-methionine-sulfoxide reductase heme-binding subunit MsrQ n=1 Tax=Chelatococcus asaccharovorans TaxID=28210 RepID=A0A2V3U6E1_9HYPH|nr:protein-methionine-sulfoxide reductase heme-binding subunit MsrQ [Chelatococcus asaccharovorans]MBS7704195.1 sulfoxide reductase heme-binding subunit YedZ [Chelatococcus asaccharovorans]PXW53177.1 sulfoxide reductase heme-binding subunit YedZ [Chelatococcus asaccharovorans]